MDRPKHHWLVFLGLALVSCGVVVLGLQWLQPKTDDGKQPPVTTLQSQARSPERAASPAAATPAPAETSGAVLRGQVIDAETREPIEQFAIQLQLLQHDLEVEPPPVTRTFRSGTGRFAWQDTPLGAWRVVVVAADHQHFQIENSGFLVTSGGAPLVGPGHRAGARRTTGRHFRHRNCVAGARGSRVREGLAARRTSVVPKWDGQPLDLQLR